MHHSDLDSVSTAAIVVTADIQSFPSFLTAHVAKPTSARRHYVLVHNQDQKSIAIELVRELKNATSYSLGGHEHQEIVLLWADLLTLPAQHALLKLLEEPPLRTRLWLVTDKPQALLDTISSRCIRLIQPSNSARVKEQPVLSKKLREFALASTTTASYSQLMHLAATPKDRAEALAWCNELLIAARSEVKATSCTIQNQLLQTLERLQQNANIKLSLEHCLFTIKESH